MASDGRGCLAVCWARFGHRGHVADSCLGERATPLYWIGPSNFYFLGPMFRPPPEGFPVVDGHPPLEPPPLEPPLFGPLLLEPPLLEPPPLLPLDFAITGLLMVDESRLDSP